MIVIVCEEILSLHQEKIIKETGEQIFLYCFVHDIPANVAASMEFLVAYGPSFGKGKKATFEKFPNLKWVHWLSAGIDDLSVHELNQRSITLTNVSGIHVKPMSEYVLMCMLYFEKDLGRYITLKEKKSYDRSKLVGELTGLNVLIYGTGIIGEAIAKTLSFFNMTVNGVNTTGRAVPHFHETYTLEEVEQQIGDADYVISLLPSTTKTRNFFSKTYLQKMKQQSVFISIGRGDVVDEVAVVEMVESKALKGAALDVFRQEPLPVESGLWDCENIILTPHMSAKSIYYMDRCVDIFIKNIQARQRGDIMMNVIDTSREY